MAWFIPSAFTRLFGLLSTAITLVWSIVAVCCFHADDQLYVDLGLRFVRFSIDSLSFAMILLTNAVFLLVFLSNFTTKIVNDNKFIALALLMQFGLIGVFTTNTILGFYIFWELTLLPIFLILYWFGSFEKPRALLQFFLYTLLGSLAMLLSVIGLMHAGNEITYEGLLAADLNSLGNTSIILMGGFLFAFAVKIPLFPFHTWQAETYTKAPVAGTMLLSAIMLKMALFGLLKWVLPIFDGVATDFWRWPIITLGLIGVVYGAVIAIRQSDIKTLFAYASLSHLGLIAAALMLNDYDTNQIAVVQIVNHSIVSIGLFLAAGIIEQRLGTRLALGGDQVGQRHRGLEPLLIQALRGLVGLTHLGDADITLYHDDRGQRHHGEQKRVADGQTGQPSPDGANQPTRHHQRHRLLAIVRLAELSRCKAIQLSIGAVIARYHCGRHQQPEGLRQHGKRAQGCGQQSH